VFTAAATSTPQPKINEDEIIKYLPSVDSITSVHKMDENSSQRDTTAKIGTKRKRNIISRIE